MIEDRRQVWSEHNRTKMSLMQSYEDFLLAYNKCMIGFRVRGSIHKRYLAEIEASLSMLHAIAEVTHAIKPLTYITEYFLNNMLIGDDYNVKDRNLFKYREITEDEERYFALRRIRDLLVADMKLSDIFNVTIQKDNRPMMAKQAEDETF